MNYVTIPGFKYRPQYKNTCNDFPEQVSRIAAQELGVKWEDIFTHSRKQKLVYCRNISFYLIRKHSTLFSMVALADYFGGRDHSTVVHGIQSVNNMLRYDDHFKTTVKNIEECIYKCW